MEPRDTHSALAPKGVEAKHIAQLFDAYFELSAVVFTLVIAALGFALGRKPVLANEKKEAVLGVAGKRKAVLWATVATVTVLVGLLVGSVATGHAMAPASGDHPLHVCRGVARERSERVAVEIDHALGQGEALAEGCQRIGRVERRARVAVEASGVERGDGHGRGIRSLKVGAERRTASSPGRSPDG